MASSGERRMNEQLWVPPRLGLERSDGEEEEEIAEGGISVLAARGGGLSLVGGIEGGGFSLPGFGGGGGGRSGTDRPAGSSDGGTAGARLEARDEPNLIGTFLEKYAGIGGGGGENWDVRSVGEVLGLAGDGIGGVDGENWSFWWWWGGDGARVDWVKWGGIWEVGWMCGRRVGPAGMMMVGGGGEGGGGPLGPFD